MVQNYKYQKGDPNLHFDSFDSFGLNTEFINFSIVLSKLYIKKYRCLMVILISLIIVYHKIYSICPDYLEI